MTSFATELATPSPALWVYIMYGHLTAFDI